jgi:ureidoglycolate dehydrogenase (NAD+)
MPILKPDLAHRLMYEVLRELGASESAAGHVAGSLLQTSLRGVDSHGVRLFPHYTRALRSGRISREPDFHFDQSGTTTATLHADAAFGHEAGSLAMARACDLAEAHGTGMVAVCDSSHLGAASYFGLQAAERGLIGFAFTNADSLVKVPGSPLPFFGTNPVCFCAPMADEAPLCLDMATSTVAWNKMMRFAGGEIPSDWAFDLEGRPALRPEDAASLAPTGGYKGFGLGMMVSVLCCLLGDGPMDPDVPPMYKAPIEQRRSLSHCFLAIRVASFVPQDKFRRRLSEMAARIRALAAYQDSSPMVPGDPEKANFAQRSVTGIPVSLELRDEFLAVSPAFANAFA